jgi:hypothetical protein
MHCRSVLLSSRGEVCLQLREEDWAEGDGSEGLNEGQFLPSQHSAGQWGSELSFLLLLFFLIRMFST